MAKLIILCGLPGSGKSHYAQGYKDFDDAIYEGKTVVHSSDAIRKELFGDACSQEDNGKVFELMRKRTQEDLRAGKTVIYDATNITRKARKSAIACAHPTRDTVEVHIVWSPINVCLRRDALRDRSVGPEVINKMLRRWQSPDPVTECFDSIKLICTDPDFDQVNYVSRKTAEMHIAHDNPHHTLDVYDHCLQASLNIANCGEKVPEEVLVATYWHDIGKPYTKFFKQNKETGELETIAHYYDHQNVGAYLAYGLFLNRDILSPYKTTVACKISWYINMHMEPFFNSKFYNTLPAYEKHWIDVIHEADTKAH